MSKDRDALIKHIGATIYELRDIADKAGEVCHDAEIKKRNAEGWTLDIRLPNGTYHDERSFTRLEEITLSEAELARALAYAKELVEIAEPWRRHLRILHGGDQRRIGSSGRTIDNLAAAIPAAKRSVIKWLHGEAVPNLAARAAIGRLYNETLE